LLAVLSPPLTALHFVSHSVSEGFSRYIYLVNLEKSNRELRRENAKLNYELYQLQGFRRIVESDERYDILRKTYTFDTIRAGVIWRGYPMYSNRILVNAGESDGVEKNSAVITPEGIVGRVIVTTLFSSEIELLTDVNSAAGALLAGSGIQGVVEGDGSERLLLQFIPVSEQVEPGQLLLTSGGDRIYPKGLPIGTVITADKKGAYQTLIVRPSVDFDRLNDVAIVVSDH
jgi:rod shape-determining protein MreC